MIPVITLVGRSNVGKSTLFNRLTNTRNALVADFPGLTRDRIYGRAIVSNYEYIIIDTGGIENTKNSIGEQIVEQSLLAIKEADLVLFIVDARIGLMPADYSIANNLRRLQKMTVLIANKIDGIDPDIALCDFYSLGFGKAYAITASHGHGIRQIIAELLVPFFSTFKYKTQSLLTKKDVNFQYLINLKDKEVKKIIKEKVNNCILKEDKLIKIVIVGRPNVGKSTLINCILGEKRVVVDDTSGTTRDSIYIPIVYNKHKYILIDTAGVSKRGKIINTIEKFSIIKTIQAIEHANVALLIIDAQNGISDQDLSLLSIILDSGRSLVIVVNKWDSLSANIKNNFKNILELRLGFINFARIHFISALYSIGIKDLFQYIQEAYDCATQHISTSLLTNIMNKAQQAHQPALVQGRRIKLKYAHAGGYNPLIVVIHGNQLQHLTSSYERYLVNYFRSSLKIIGTPIRIQFKVNYNPYSSKRNILRPNQLRKRKRMLTYINKN
ncbi:GTPase Der [Candidatus Profftia lariciata]|uniref:ribosome biogenesis GTPase Der n=1 Tax=Candidatus Profftia lariciata TaxID=1987921 RepID=UPI001D023B1A|nr:ribosome biogenesis GTPase Der [Candidatus Profftia lariciata]UDG81748.1 GTPase Der [Candidatus Profftia lariciata]